MIADKSSRGEAGITGAADISGTHTRIIFQFALLFLGSGLSQQAWPFKAADESGEMVAHSSARRCLKWQPHKTKRLLFDEPQRPTVRPAALDARLLGPQGLPKGPPYDSREEKVQHTHSHTPATCQQNISQIRVYVIQNVIYCLNMSFST